MEKIVGHKTFINPDGTFRHEPLNILDACEADRAKREADMPTEQEAVNKLWEAWYRLKELGWKEARYRPDEGVLVDVIELGSTGIHRATYMDRAAVLFRKVST